MVDADLLVFDDGQGCWGPLTARRPIFLQRTGAVTTVQRIERVLGQTVRALRVPARLAPVTGVEYRKVSINGRLAGRRWRLVNGRWPATAYIQLVRELKVGEALVQPDGQVVAAVLEGDQAEQFVAQGWTLGSEVTAAGLGENLLMGGTWSVLDELETALMADLAASDVPLAAGAALAGVTLLGDGPVRLGDGAQVAPGAVIDTSGGPVVLEAGATVRPLAMLEGPCFVGAASVVVPQGVIRRNTVIGPRCKVGGEVSCSVLQGYSNKAHGGFLGHSLVGCWCNLGAQTTVSNLKNTYGPVRLRLSSAGAAVDTGRAFHGPVLGDFVRTAIGTRLPTGAVVGVGCMLALSGFAPRFTPDFGFYTDAGRQVYDLEKFLGTARMMMGRRDCELSEVEVDLLRRLHGQACVQAAQANGQDDEAADRGG